MKYEIINPSDECYIECENETVACFCTILLGNGMYALNNDNDETILPILFDYVDEWVKNHVGDVETFMNEHIDEIIQCLRSVEYARERTSMNNIQGLAFTYADSIEKHKKEGQK